MTPGDAPAQLALFGNPTAAPDQPIVNTLEPGAALLHGFALDEAPTLLSAIADVARHSPWRHMHTARGWRMAVAMTNCGDVGWLSDRAGYRYGEIDPLTNGHWPAMPPAFTNLASRAAAIAGFKHFVADACLINRYEPGVGLSLHQDRNEQDFTQPIVSVSLGVPATFLWGGGTRAVRPRKLPLVHGDVVVWGAQARLHFHGIAPLKATTHALTGQLRLNITFRRAR